MIANLLYTWNGLISARFSVNRWYSCKRRPIGLMILLLALKFTHGSCSNLASIPSMQAASSTVDCTSFEGWCHKLSCVNDCKEKSDDSFCSCCCHSYFDNIDTAKILKTASRVSSYAVHAKYVGSGATKMAETSTATEAAAQLVTNSGVKTLAKKAFFLSVAIEGTFVAYDIKSAYYKKQQAISQEGLSDKQVKHAEDQFHKEVVGHTMSAAGAVGGFTTGAVVGSLFCPGLGTFVGAALGNIVGEYVGSQAGKTVGGAMFDSNKK